MPTKLTTYKTDGQKASPTTVPEVVFGLEVANHQLLKTAHETYWSNRRSAGAKTKTRGLVRGGGRKPWRQKGTGRARAGSIRSPIWRGGGVVFGPTGGENYRQRLPKKAKRLAVRQALSLKRDQTIIVEGWPDASRTADLNRFLAKLPLKRRRLIIAVEFSPKQHRAAANLAELELRTATHLNVADILAADSIAIVVAALEPLTAWLSPTPPASAKPGLVADKAEPGDLNPGPNKSRSRSGEASGQAPGQKAS